MDMEYSDEELFTNVIVIAFKWDFSLCLQWNALYDSL